MEAGPVEVLAPAKEYQFNSHWSFFRIDVSDPELSVMADSETISQSNEARMAFDGNEDTIWQTPSGGEAPAFPHWIQRDLGKLTKVTGLRLLPRQDGTNGWINSYEVHVSDDGKDWGTPEAKGNLSQDSTWKTISFEKALETRFIRLSALSGFDVNPFVSLAEFEILPKHDVEHEPEDYSAKELDVSAWQTVNLPHTPRIEPKEFASHWQGECWYRRQFFLHPEMQGKKIFIKFEGVMQLSTVWVNGQKVATHAGGYLPFSIDLSALSHLHYDGKSPNVFVVRADNRDQLNIPPGLPLRKIDMTYQGGIYRDVTMLVTDGIHITDAVHANQTAGGGIFVKYPEVTQKHATIEVQTSVQNDRSTSQPISVRCTLFDPSGKSVARSQGARYEVDNGTGHHFTQKLVVEKPLLWHPDHPNRYRLQVDVVSQNKTVDSRAIQIGIRKIDWKNDGFYINGEKLILHGANRHQDGMYIGNALPENAQRLDALKLREGGFNNVRAGHYPLDPNFMDACDQYGLTVIACIPGWHCYRDNPEFLRNSYRDVRELVRRDRNHPSVILYEPILNESRYSEKYARETHRITKEEDPSCFTACDHNYPAYQIYDVNYKHPGTSKPFFSREWGDDNRFEGLHGITWGDWARRSDEPSMIYQSQARQKDLNGDGYWDWHGVNAKPTTAGFALWSGIDHNRGGSPNIARCGVLGLDRYPKFCYYFLRSQQSPGKNHPYVDAGPMVFIASHWTQQSSSNIHVYTNAEKVRLYQDGQLLGERGPDKMYREGEKKTALKHVPHPIITFDQVRWKPGQLRADAIIGGQVVATHSVSSPGEASKLELSMDHINDELVADGSDMAMLYIKAVDDKGVLNPHKTGVVRLKIKGHGRLIGVNPVPLEGGVGAIWLRSTTTPGDVVVSAMLNGLADGQLTIKTRPNSRAIVSGPPLPKPPVYRGDESGATTKAQAAGMLKKVPFRSVKVSSSRKGSSRKTLHDGDFETWWIAASNQNQQIDIELAQPHDLIGSLIEWEKDSTWYQFSIEVSTDKSNWKPVYEGKQTGHDHEMEKWSARKVKFVRIKIASVHPADSILGIREIDLFE